MTDWKIDGSEVPTVTDEVLTPRTLTLVWRSSKSNTQTHLRPLQDHAGKARPIDESTGAFTTADLAGGSNTFSLAPHSSRTVVHAGGSYFPVMYRERPIQQSADEYRVEVEFYQPSSRTKATSLSQSATGSEWLFSFHVGPIATERIPLDFRTPTAPREGTTVPMFLDASQAQVVVETLSRPGGVRVREVPDGTNAAEDNTANTRHTASLAVPSVAASLITSGQYVATEYELRTINSDWYRADVTFLSP